jgi:deoxyribodipyrimidine photolyase-related protein
MQVALVYPHQLYENHPAVAASESCLLVEDPLFFTQFAFHRQKLLLHRASMKEFAARLQRQGKQTLTIDSCELQHTEDILQPLSRLGARQVVCVDPCDDWLRQRLETAFGKTDIELTILDDPNFLTPVSAFDEYVSGQKRWHFTDFYIAQRKRLGILLDGSGRPVGGKWSFDSANRKKLPRDAVVPTLEPAGRRPVMHQTESSIHKEFPGALGCSQSFCYPTTSKDAAKWLAQFLEHRFEHFGIYEDAIDSRHAFLFHSVLTPALNIGLLSPGQVVEASLEYQDRVPINSLEGFIRQVIGWREYMRGVYLGLGRRQRVSNFWGHENAMPSAFYDGSTGIEPVDTVIGRVLKYGYCHHIERLMILGNFMLLCEIAPKAIYRWFMELFIDAYDWVMVPNVYGMSQFADGGLITTKPYISGSAYVLKMSNFKRADWCPIWDALYWRFIDKHRDFFASNPRMSVMVAQCNRMGSRLDEHRRTADRFLEQLFS